MFILLIVSLLFLTAVILVILNWVRPAFRYAWFVAASGSLIAWVSVLLWQPRLPVIFQLPTWEPTTLFLQSLSFTADSLTWPYAFSIATLTLAVILTAGTRENFPDPLPWAATLILGGLGILAVLADNPLSLLMVWAAIDLAELIAQLRSVDGPQPSEKVVTAFATRVAGTGMLLWASMVSAAAGIPLDFHATPSQAGLYLLIAAGLRLGVLPLHLPYASESAVRRGFGSALRLVSAASSLVLLTRIPSSSVLSPFTPYLLALTAFAAVYGSWMWLRAPDELSARPYWLIGLASLAMASVLHANPVGATAWGLALILSGGALFLSSVYQTWINRALLVGMLAISALPFSLTSTGWQAGESSLWLAWPFFLAAQAFLLAGFFRHALRPALRASFDSLERWVRVTYSTGIGILLAVSVLLGLWGWEGALRLGPVIQALVGTLTGSGVIWLAPRLRLLTPVRAHWVQGRTGSWTDWFFRGLWNIYRTLGRLSRTISATLEGDGGMMWTLLFLVLFVSLLAQRTPGQ